MTIMKKISTSILLLCAVFAVSCSSDVTAPREPENEAPVPIVLSAGMSLQSETRGAGMIDQNYADNLGVNFLLLEQNASTGAYPADYSGFSAGSQIPATRSGGSGSTAVNFDSGSERYYPVRDTNNKVKLIGWYPRVDGTVVTLSSGVLTFTIDGSTDVMLTSEVEGSKATGDKFSDSGKEFTFSHLLTQFRIKAYAVDAAAVASWGTLTDIQVKSQLPRCTVTLPATVGFDGSAANLALVKKVVTTNADITYPLTLPLAATDCGYAMVPPVTSPTVLTLVVTTEKGGTRDVPLTVQNYEKSKAYEVSLKFTAGAITASAQIGAWTPVPVSDIEL